MKKMLFAAIFAAFALGSSAQKGFTPPKATANFTLTYIAGNTELDDWELISIEETKDASGKPVNKVFYDNRRMASPDYTEITVQNFSAMETPKGTIRRYKLLFPGNIPCNLIIDPLQQSALLQFNPPPGSLLPFSKNFYLKYTGANKIK